MSNWPFAVAGVITEAVGVSGDLGTAVTPNTGAYGAWTSLGGSFSRDVDGFWFIGATDQNSAAGFLFCVAVGSGADANMIVEGGWCEAGYYENSTIVWCPVRVNAGQTIYVKLAAAAGTHNKECSVVGVAGNFPQPVGFSKMIGLGIASFQPFSLTMATSGTTWAQVVSSTAKRYSALGVQMGLGGLGNGQRYRWRAAIGAAASEQTILGDFVGRKGSIASKDTIAGSAFPLVIPASTRLSVAANSDSAVALTINLCGLEG